MSNIKQRNCTCGGTYNSQGICSDCGKKRPRSAGYRILHTVLCIIGILILWFCFGNTAALRSYSASSALTDAMRSARISDTDLPFTGKNLAEYIRSHYVSDENVLPEDIAEAADGMNIPTFLADKLDAHFALLRGESDTPVRIEADEITGLLDPITESLRESCKLVIEDSDRQQIQDAAEPVLGTLNAFSDAFGSNVAGRAVQRFCISIWNYIPIVVLLGLLIWRWCIIRKNSGKDIAGAFKGVGITIIIPAELSLLFVLIGGIKTLFVRDDVIGMFGVTKVLRSPFWFIAVTGVTFALFMIELGAFLRARKLYMESAAAKQAAAAKQRQANDTPVVPVYRVPCVKCGKELDSGAKFCQYCGAKQTVSETASDTAANAPADIPESPDDHEPKWD